MVIKDETGFPWREYTKDELLKEYIRLKTHIKKNIKKEITFPISFSSIGFICTNYFFQYERMNTSGFNRGTTIEYWNKKKDKIISFSNKENRDFFSTLNYFNHAPSQFPIMIAAKLYNYFNVKKILDPYAGWGDRCLAAMASDIDYTGIDSNTNLKEPYTKLINEYKTNSKIEIIFKKSEDVNIDDMEFDFVFTSPPFWRNNKLLEVYNNTEKEYNNFLNNSLIPVLKKCFNKNVWVCLYIPENMYIDIVKNFEKCHLEIDFKSSKVRSEKIYCWKF
jgi:16S rRNA G966 N2-methylase RsmD